MSLRDRLRLPPALATVAVQGVDMVSQVAAGVLVARLLGPAAMGDFTFALAVAGVLAIVVLWGASEVSVSLYAGGKHEPAEILEASFRALGRGCTVTVLLTVLLLAVMRPAQSTVVAVALSVTTLLVNGVASTFNYAILGRRASARDLPVVVVARALQLGVVLAGVLAGSLPLAMAGLLLGAVALSAGRALVVQRHLFPLRRHRSDAVRAVFSERGRWIGLSSVFGVVSARIDMFLLQRLTPGAELGLYGGCYRVINGVTTGASATAQALFPGMTSGQPELRARAQRNARLVSFGLSAIPALALPFAAAIAVAIYGEGWREAGPIFGWLLAANVLQVQTAFRSRRLVADGREKLLPFGQGFAAVVNVGLNLTLIPLLGARGAAIATFAAEATALTVYLTGPRLLAWRQARRASDMPLTPASPAA